MILNYIDMDPRTTIVEVLRIRFILIQIRILGSAFVINGSISDSESNKMPTFFTLIFLSKL